MRISSIYEIHLNPDENNPKTVEALHEASKELYFALRQIVGEWERNEENVRSNYLTEDLQFARQSLSELNIKMKRYVYYAGGRGLFDSRTATKEEIEEISSKFSLSTDSDTMKILDEELKARLGALPTPNDQIETPPQNLSPDTSVPSEKTEPI